MSRARIEALAMVNWRGIFYERLLFDRAVTALEGTNGAGKTTVMVAVYVALFPELGKLRFTNLGEHDGRSGDRGIYGRLGDTAWPRLHRARSARRSRRACARGRANHSKDRAQR